MCTLEIGRANVEKCSGQFTPEQQTAYIGIRFYKVVNARSRKQRFNLDSFTQFLSDVREIQLSTVKKFGFLAKLINKMPGAAGTDTPKTEYSV